MHERRRRKGKPYLRFENVGRRFARLFPRFRNVRRRVGLFARFRNIRRNCAGETLIELLASLLVVSFASLILSGAITSAARIDARTRNLSKRGELDWIPAIASAPTVSVRLTRSDGLAIAVPVSMTLQTVNGKNLYRYDAP